MFKILFFLFLFLSFLNALEINELENSYKFNDFKIFYDKDSSSSIDEIIKNKDKFEKTNNSSIGIKKYIVWTYSSIINNTKEKEKLVFVNPRAGIDFIDIYIFKDEILFKNYKLGDMNPLENRDYQDRKSNFTLEINPNEKYEIFFKYKSFGSIDINWDIYSLDKYSNLVKKESLKHGIILGIVSMTLLGITYLIIYFPTIPTYLYFFILLGSISTQFSVAGIFFEMGLSSYLNTIISWSFGNVAAAMVGIFPIYYFNLKKLMPKTTIILSLLSLGLLILSFSFLFYPLKNELLYFAPIANIIFFVISLILIFISFILMKKNIDGWKIYTLGNGVFLSAIIYFILGLLGIVSTNSLFYLSLGIGTFFNIICLGFLIFSNLVKIKKQKEQAIVIINEYSKLSSVGQSMINLSHQWKEPLNHIYYAMNNIYAAREFKDPDVDSITNESLKQIKETVSYMTNTGQNFLNLYEDKNYIEKVNLKTSIESVLIIFRKQIDELNIELGLKLNNNIEFQTNKYLLANIFMAIIENAIKIFKNKKIKNPKLNINIQQTDDEIEIIISDNGGGIKVTPINSIFEKDLTDSNSTGLGLFLVKNILSLKLNGTIDAKNKENGSIFTIKIKKEDSF
jgi:two-component system, sensor histidine kinase LadS